MGQPFVDAPRGAFVHATWGFLGAMCMLLGPAGPIVMAMNFLIFLVYEMDQDWHKDDWLDEETCEYAAGWGIGAALLIIGKVVSNLIAGIPLL